MIEFIHFVTILSIYYNRFYNNQYDHYLNEHKDNYLQCNMAYYSITQLNSALFFNKNDH